MPFKKYWDMKYRIIAFDILINTVNSFIAIIQCDLNIIMKMAMRAGKPGARTVLGFTVPSDLIVSKVPCSKIFSANGIYSVSASDQIAISRKHMKTKSERVKIKRQVSNRWLGDC